MAGSILPLTKQMVTQLKKSKDASGKPLSYSRVAYYDETLDTPLTAFDADTAPPPERPRTVVGFSEETGDQFEVAVRVFIQGVEITEKLKTDFAWQFSDVSGNNTCSFTLSNADDSFVLRPENLRQRVPSIKDDGSFNQNVLNEVKSNGQPLLFLDYEKIKEQIFNYKADPARNPQRKSPTNSTFDSKFPLLPHSCIIGKMDPIRAWVRVPNFSSEDEVWMPAFTGYVWDVTINDDFIKGESHIQVECVDFRQAVLRGMRVSFDMIPPQERQGVLNPLDQVFGATANTAVEFKDSIFSDLVTGNIYGQPGIVMGTNGPVSIPIEEIVKRFLVGDQPLGGDGIKGVQDGGLYQFPRSTGSAKAGRSEIIGFLQEWHRLSLFGPKRRPWTYNEVTQVGKGTTSDGEYAPNKVRLWRLVPSEGSGPKNLADVSTTAYGGQHDVNWTTREEAIKNSIEALDYSFYVSGIGDMFLEFSMADFRPEDFGEFYDAFRVDKHIVSGTVADENGDFPTAVLATSGFGYTASANDKQANQLTKSVAYSPSLAARVGVRVHPLNLPFLLIDEQKTNLLIARQLAAIELQKQLSAANQLSVNYKYRPFIVPNRPFEHVRRARMGRVVTVSNSITMARTPTGQSGLSLQQVRRWTGEIRKNWKFKDLDANQVATLQAQLEDNIDAIRSADPNATIASVISGMSGEEVNARVYETIAGGETTPMSAAVGWGVGSISPTSGIYCDLQPTVAAKNKSNAPPPSTESDESVEPFAFAPLSECVVTSRYGQRGPLVTAGNEREAAFHAGIDLRASVGTPFFAVDSGVVTSVEQGRTGDGVGKILRIKLDRGETVSYVHLESFGTVDPGDPLSAPLGRGTRVSQGQMLGTTGDGNGQVDPHLHIEVKKLGAQYPSDPAPYLKDFLV